MIPKHSFACLSLLVAVAFAAPVQAAVAGGTDTTIGAMETRLFSHPYANETEGNRLNRLEKFVFGAASNEGTAADRLAKLMASLPAKNIALKPVSLVAQADHSAVNGTTIPANVSSYPRVTQLEMRLLGKSFFGEPIATRLSRLEYHEFGKVSTSNDLAGRMDALAAITTSNADKTRVNELASWQSPALALANYRQHVYQTFADSPVSVVKDQPTTVVDQIEYLESTAFGKKCCNKSLQKRVDALETKYFGELKVADKNLTYRVAQLLTLVNSNNSPKPGISRG